MNPSSVAPSGSRSSDLTLDDALEQVVNALESDQPLDREGLVQQFPLWADDLNRFIDNWLAMEQKTASLAESRETDFLLSCENLNGRLVGDYELLELISRGGMGVVYRARQLSLGRTVALKMVMNAVRDKTRFRIEAEAAASLHHANIVAIHEVGEYQGQPFLSMQYIGGGNLQDHLTPGPMAPRAAATLVRSIAIAVHYAHQRGILHRDLKPANVLLDAERRPYVSDFGLAKQIGNSAELTRSGAILGTPGYMAPEQAMGQVKSITVAADVYGLGAILYAALTGNAPFKSDSDLLTLRKVIEEPPVSPRVVRPDLDRNLETICLKCLEKSPVSRYGSAKQLAEDLSRFLQGEPVVARPIGFLERRWRWCVRNPAMAVISFFAGLMVSAVALMSLGFAWREYEDRMNAEFATIREAAMKEAVETARIDAESKNHKAQQAVADLYTTNGHWASRTNRFGESLLWFARAASLEGIPKAIGDDSKTRCSSWLSQCPTPIAAMQLSNPLQGSTFQSDWSSWQLSAAHSEVMFKAGDDFGIWNFRNDEIWRPTGNEFLVCSAAWSNDGKRLALASRRGELRLLDATTKASKATVLLDGELTSVAFSPSSKMLLVGASRDVLILSADDLSVVSSLTIDTPCLYAKSSRDETKLAVVTNDGKVTLHEILGTSTKKVAQFQCYLPPPHSFAHAFVPEFSEDSKKLFVRTEERRMRVFDCTTGEQLGKPIVTGSTYSVALSPDQSHCLVGGDSYARLQTIKWDEKTPSYVRHNYRFSHNNAVTSLAFGGNQLVATAGRDQIVQLFRVGEEKLPGSLIDESDTPLATLVHTDSIEGLLYNNRNQLVTVQRDGLVRVWKVPSFSPPGYSVQVPRGGATVKPVGSDRWLIAGASHWRGKVINASLRRTKDGVVVAETPLNALGERGHLLDSALSREQDKLVTLHANPARSTNTMVSQNPTAGSILVWLFPEGRPNGPSIPVRAEPRSVAIHPSGSMAAVLLVNMEILLIDLLEPSITATLTSETINQTHGNKPSISNLHNGQLQFNKEGNRLFAWGIDGSFCAWNWGDRKRSFPTDFAKEWKVRLLVVSPTENKIAMVDDRSNRMVVVDCVSGNVLREVPFTTKVRSVEFSPSGRELLIAADDQRARILDLQNEANKGHDLVHDKKLLDACYSPDGSNIATLTNDMQLFVWRARDRQWLTRPMSVPPGTQEIVFSADSKHILTMSLGSDSVQGNELRVLDLSGRDRVEGLDLQFATMLGELTAARTISESGINSMTSAEWIERWKAYRTEYFK
jgi:WD40 repeat protein